MAVDPSGVEPSLLDALFAEQIAARCLAREDGRIVRQNAEWSRYLAMLDPTSLPVDVPLRAATLPSCASRAGLAARDRSASPLTVLALGRVHSGKAP